MIPAIIKLFAQPLGKFLIVVLTIRLDAMPVLYNTLTRKKEVFRPMGAGMVGMYTCGITAYYYAHVGNMRAYLQEDVIKRVLTHSGYSVKHIQNVTDVGHLVSDADTGEDKLRLEADREHRSMADVAELYTKYFIEDCKALNVVMPDRMPKATGHIGDMLKLIGILDEKGYLYTAHNGVYFDTSKFEGYGRLTGLSFERLNNELREGARVERVEGKRNPTDFAVWRFAHGDEKEMVWESKWGRGFPGWHLECSAMSMKYLGEHFDLHMGGIDHIQIHHTNEIAQSEAATGRKFVNYWMHMNFLTVDGGKMSKSLRNIYTIRDITGKGHPPMALRLFLISGHYRQGLNFTFEALQNTERTLNGIYAFLERLPEAMEAKGPGSKEFLSKVRSYRDTFFKELGDDINMPGALASMHGLIREANSRAAQAGFGAGEADAVKAAMLEMDTVLGLGFKDYMKRAKPSMGADIRALVDERERARRSKDFARADGIRELLREKYHVILEDTENGVRWRTERAA